MQVLAALFLHVVVGAVLFHLFVLFQDFFLHLLVFFGARCQLPALGIQLGKAAGDVLHTGVQQAILIILSIEVIFVTLSLVHGHQWHVLHCIVRHLNCGGEFSGLDRFLFILTFVRNLGDNFSALFLSTVPLFGSVSLFSLLCYTGRTSAAFCRTFPFLPLSILLFVLLGFLFKLLVGTAGQRRAGDDSRGNRE